MVSFNVYRSTYSGAYVEGICLATDEKPVVGIANGSILYAVDISTGETTRYMYDQESMSWIEAACPCSGGGSGGGGGVEPLIINLQTDMTTGELISDKTFGEIYDAFKAGRNGFCVYAVEYEGDVSDCVYPLVFVQSMYRDKTSETTITVGILATVAVSTDTSVTPQVAVDSSTDAADFPRFEISS